MKKKIVKKKTRSLAKRARTVLLPIRVTKAENKQLRELADKHDIPYVSTITYEIVREFLNTKERRLIAKGS